MFYIQPTTKYAIWYNDLINTRSNSTPQVFETHHIIPKSIGGNNDDDNLIRLTPREHFIAHFLLMKHFRKVGTKDQSIKMTSAFHYMSLQNTSSAQGVRVNSLSYQAAKKTHASMMSDIHKGKVVSDETKKRMSESTKGQKHSEKTRKLLSELNKGEKHPMYGKSHTLETKVLMSKAHQGENHHMYGKSPSDETRNKISESLKGKNKVPKEKIVCPHCGTEGGKPVMKRFHFDNCKHQ